MCSPVMSPNKNAAALWEQAGETTATSTHAHKKNKVGYHQMNLGAFYWHPPLHMPDLYMWMCLMEAILNVYTFRGV